MGVFQTNVFQNNVFQGPHVEQRDTGGPGRMVAGHWSKGKWVTHEREKYRRRLEQEQRRRRRAALSALDRALEDLAAAQTALAKADASFAALHTRESYEALVKANDRVAELTRVVAEERVKAAAARDARAKVQAEQERFAQEAAARAAFAEQMRQQALMDAQIGAERSQMMAQQMASAQHRAMQAAMAQQAMMAQRQAAIDDENDVIALLLEIA